MERTVERSLIDNWVDRNGPDGLVKLAQAAGVSSSLMSKVRIGRVPKQAATRIRICKALRTEEDTLFPPVDAGEEEAS